MVDVTTSGTVSTGLLAVAERARNDPRERIRGLARFVDEACLTRSHGRIRKDAAVGVDQVTAAATLAGLVTRFARRPA